MLDVVRFWLDIGLDGFRLDAVPYLFERDGTNGENLPETHDFLSGCARRSTRATPTRCCWPRPTSGRATSSTTSASGDECHMCFHFPLMPRMFMAIRREERKPIIETLAQTRRRSPTGQWGLFLRNHDELTLEMVTDDERDYMYSEYAKDPRMKRNVGIAPAARHR